MKRCTQCVLPETFPGVKFDKDGVCNFCSKFKGVENLEEKKRKYKKKFEELVKTNSGKGCYDAIMSYSGGKDSSYTLAVLREDLNLNVLALTFDNGFLPEQTFNNIQIVTGQLGIDLIIYKPNFDLLKKIFVESSKKSIYSSHTLSRASTICTSCIAFVKFGALRMALEKEIPFNSFGWSPGQIPLASSIMKNNPRMIKVMQGALYKPLHAIVGDKIKPFFLEEKHFEGDYVFPYNVSPLAFLDYDEEHILGKISNLGWVAPEDIDSNSTNCLLNSYANCIHISRYGFHPYVFEISGLIREGCMERSVGLEKICEPQKAKTIELVKKKLVIPVGE